MDAGAEVGVLADEDAPVDLGPQVEPAVAPGLEPAAEPHPLAPEHVPSPDAELHGALAADEHVAVGHEVVLLDRRPVRDDEFVERLLAQGHARTLWPGPNKAARARPTPVRRFRR